jgi:hypothetical protein
MRYFHRAAKRLPHPKGLDRRPGLLDSNHLVGRVCGFELDRWNVVEELV